MTNAVPLRILPLTVAALACTLAVKAADLARSAAAPGRAGAAASLATAGQAVLPSALAAPPSVSPAHAASTVASAAGTTPIADPPVPDVGEAERDVLLDLRREKEALDRREQAEAERETLLGGAEARLTARVGELKALQTRLEQLEAARRAREEADWRGLVKVYETMKPRDAASIMDGLDEDVTIRLLDRMKEAKAAPVLAAMDPARARDATAKLAALRSGPPEAR